MPFNIVETVVGKKKASFRNQPPVEEAELQHLVLKNWVIFGKS